MRPLEMIQNHMGGTWTIQCFPWTSPVSRKGMEDLIGEAFAEVRRIEDLLTDFRDSPFERINQMAGLTPVAVPGEIIDLILQAGNYSEETAGAFDISYASVGYLWRQARKTGLLPAPAEINLAQKLVDYRNIQIDRGEGTVFLPQKGMRIGLGGIGKGYAVDKVFAFLRENQTMDFLVNGAGDIRVYARPDSPRPWRIGVRNPFSAGQEAKMGVVQLGHGAVATSGDYVNYIRVGQNPEKLHHIINPTNGRPTTGVVSATLLAPTAMEADVLATAMMVMGVSRGISFLNERNLKGCLVDSEGNVHLSLPAKKEMVHYVHQRKKENPAFGPSPVISASGPAL